jgi:hypothetical protein
MIRICHTRPNTLHPMREGAVRRCVTGQSSDYVATDPRKEEEEGCYMGHTSDYVATEPWMYGKEDPCAGPGWRERTARKGQNPTPQASAEGTV